MEESLYNILWIDDEHESLAGTKGRARRNGLNLIPFKSLNSGIKELEMNYPQYDGVLLDAKFFENENDEPGTEDTFSSFRAKERILQLPKKFEIFVLTGQAEAYEDRTYKKAFVNVYEKGKDDDIEQLFRDLKEAAMRQEDTQIRFTYSRAFEVCSEKYIGELAGQDQLALIKAQDDTNAGHHFNTIRKILEDLFLAFNKFNLLPVEFVSPNVNLNQSSIFLAGKDQYDSTDDKYKKYRHLEGTHLPKLIASLLRNILATTQPGSHRSYVDQHVKELQTPYLLKSVLFQLLEILTWFKKYVDGVPKTENWEKIESSNNTINTYIDGRVINKNDFKGFAFFEPNAGGDAVFIPPHIVRNHSLENYEHVRVLTEEYMDNRTKELRTRVKELVKV